MKYKIIFKIEKEIEISDESELKEKSWKVISDTFNDCIFDNKNPGREEQYMTRLKIDCASKQDSVPQKSVQLGANVQEGGKDDN